MPMIFKRNEAKKKFEAWHGWAVPGSARHGRAWRGRGRDFLYQLNDKKIKR